MRKSTSRSRARLLCAGLTTGALGGSLFLGAPAAQAAALTAVTPLFGPAGTVIKVQAASATAFDTGAPAAIFTTGLAAGTTVCPTYTTAITGHTVVAATSPTKIDGDEATFTVPSTVATNTGGAPREWKLCVYNGTVAGTTAAVHDTAPPTFTVVPGATFAPNNGPSGGGNTLTFTMPATSPVFTATPGLSFSETPCPGTYGTPGNKAATATRISNTQVSAVVPAGVIGTGPSSPFFACFYTGTGGGATLIGGGASTYTVALPPITLSSTVGPWSGLNGVSIESPNEFLLGVSAPGALLSSSATCPTTFTAASGYTVVHPAAGKVRKVSNTRLALTVPPLAASGPSTPTQFQLCVYNGTSAGTSALVAAAPYTAAVVHSLSSVSPVSGTALGGTLITVTGSGFPTTPGSIMATLGGLPLLDITPVNEATFTARTPMHGVERNVPLVVTTPVGTKSLASAYSYLNGIAVSPNTASTDMDSVPVAVKGVGFLSTTFSTTPSDAHIYLVRGAYNPANDGSNNKINGAVSECSDVLPISDNELICTLRLDQRLNAAGAITPEIAVGRSSGAVTLTTVTTSRLVVASASLFTADDIGKSITQTAGTASAIPADATIVDVLNATNAIISIKPTVAAADAVVTIGPAAVRTNNTVDTTNGQAAFTAADNAFTSADLGRVITGTGIPTGATIIGIAANGAGGTLSANASADGTNITASMYEPLGVPAGAYVLTFVTNGSMGVDTTAVTYSQSTVSGSSAFTVASS